MPNLRDRVKCVITGTQTASTGTALTLGSAVQGARSFSTAYGADKTNITVVIDDGNNWQTGVANFSNANGTLTFTAIDASSSNGSALTLSGNALVSVEYLSRDHDADWPFAETTFGTGQPNGPSEAITGQAFTTITYDTIVADNFNGLSSKGYLIPQTGIYDIALKFRIADGNISGVSYGVGAGTTVGDSPSFSWAAGNTNRQGVLYRRVSPFNQGDNVQSFYYFDSTSSANYVAADCIIIRVR